MRADRTGGAPQRLDVEVEDVVPLLIGDVERRGVIARARVVHQDVDPPDSIDRLGDHAIDVCGVGDVRSDGEQREAVRGELLDDRTVALCIAGGDDHGGAGVGEPARECFAEPLVAARDEGGAAGQIEWIAHEFAPEVVLSHSPHAHHRRRPTRR